MHEKAKKAKDRLNNVAIELEFIANIVTYANMDEFRLTIIDMRGFGLVLSRLRIEVEETLDLLEEEEEK